MAQYAKYPAISVSSSSPSTGSNGTTAPTSTTQVGGPNNAGLLTPIKLTGAQNLLVDGSTVTQPISAAALPLPAGASTSALQTTGNTSLGSIDTKTPALVSGRVPVDGSGVTQPVSGTVTANAGTGTFAVSATSLPLPTGAATSAKQPALGTAGSASTDVITIQGIAGGVAQNIAGTVTSTGAAANAVFQAEGAVAGTALTATYATVITPSAAWKQFSIRNNTDVSVRISMDAGTTTHFVLDSGDALSIDMRADNVQASSGTAIQARYDSVVGTKGNLRINGLS